MEKHYGQIVEKIVRRNGYSITELADALGINRRSVYNYFQNQCLKSNIIYKIGLVVRHDFSKEFPELFTSDQFEVKPKQIIVATQSDLTNRDPTNWQDKYIQLLETYNEALKIRVSKVNANQAIAF